MKIIIKRALEHQSLERMFKKARERSSTHNYHGIIGTSKNIREDFRLICATNKNLEKMVEEGTFRKDLYYRINVIHIHLAPLRERKEDIPLLFNHFVNEKSIEAGREPPEIDPAVMNIIM